MFLGEDGVGRWLIGERGRGGDDGGIASGRCDRLACDYREIEGAAVDDA